MNDPKTAARWVSAWSTSPIDASLSESGVLDTHPFPRQEARRHGGAGLRDG